VSGTAGARRSPCRNADGVNWTKAEAEDWVSYVGLNAIGAGVILHVAIGRR